MKTTNPFLNASRAAFAELTTAEAKAWYRVKFSEFSAFLGNLAHRGISTVTRLVKPHSETTPLVPVAVETTAVEKSVPVPKTQESIAAVAFVPDVDSPEDSVNNSGLEYIETSATLDLFVQPSSNGQEETPNFHSHQISVEEAEAPETLDEEEDSVVDALDYEPTELAENLDSDEGDSGEGDSGEAQELEEPEETEQSEEVEPEVFASRARLSC